MPAAAGRGSGPGKPAPAWSRCGFNRAAPPPAPVEAGLALNIVGGEWVIIAFAALVLILGTNRLPEIARRLGKAAGEYERARAGVRDGMREMAGEPGGRGIRVAGPVATEREKLEAICASLGIDPAGRDDGDLRGMISRRMGSGGDADAATDAGDADAATDAGGDAGDADAATDAGGDAAARPRSGPSGRADE